MPTEHVLQSHLHLCEETYSLLMEENKILKETQAIPTEAFLQKKQELSTKLDLSAKQLKSLNLKENPEAHKHAELIKQSQKKLMKISLLDRENEQLFLKHASGFQAPTATKTASLNKAKKTYNA